MDVIRVNGRVITDKDIDRAMVRYVVQLEEDEKPYEPTKENLKYLRVEASNTLINRMLLVERAKRSGCSVGNEEIDSELENIRSHFESVEDWNKNMLLFQMTENDFREEVRYDMLIERLFRKEEESQPISDDVVASFYGANVAFFRMPVLYTFYEISAANRNKLSDVVQCLKTKGDIIEIENAIKELGEAFFHHSGVGEESIPEEARKVLADLRPQEIGTMILPDGGLVVYKLLSRAEGKQRSLASVRTELRQYLEKERRSQVYHRLLDEEIENADIQYLHAEYFEKR